MLRFRFIIPLILLSWLAQPINGQLPDYGSLKIGNLLSLSQSHSIFVLIFVNTQTVQKTSTPFLQLTNGKKSKELNEAKQHNSSLRGANLEDDKVQDNKNRSHLIAFWAISLLVVSILAISLFNTRRYRYKSKELSQANKKLNHINAHLESIVQNRTQDLVTMLKKAQASDKLKSTFLANMSHEIRTPLNGILGFARFLSDEDLSPETRKKYLDIINRRGMSLLHIINDLINISQIDAGQVVIKNESFNLNQLLYDLFTIFNSSTCDKKRDGVELKLNLSLNDSRSNMVSDALRIEQILTNLIDNALKFTRKGQVEFGYTVEDNNRIKFFVKDTGIGIPNDMQEKVFDRFNRYSLASPYNPSGTGLGLPISKGLVNLLKGDIWFDSQPDMGTKFYFTIPYLQASAIEQSFTSKSSITFQNLNFEGKKILVVEDDLISFQFIEALLKDTNVKIIHAKNGEDAIEISSLASDIDLVIMDMRLPFIDGYEATAQIKKQNPEMCVIAQTANVLNDDRTKCLKAGCNDYLAKPIDPDEFLRLVAHYLKKADLSRFNLSNR